MNGLYFLRYSMGPSELTSSPRPKIDSYTKMKLALSLITLVIVFSTMRVSVNDLMLLGVVLVLAVAAFLSYLYIGKR